MGVAAVPVLQMVLTAASVAATAYGAYSQSQNAADQMDDQASQLAQAAAEREQAAQEEANRIRLAGKKQRAQAKAIYAASGVDVGAGSPVVIDEDIAGAAESDAFATITTGGRIASRERQQAAAYQRSASNTRTSGLLSAGGSILGSAAAYSQASYKPGWRTVDTSFGEP